MGKKSNRSQPYKKKTDFVAFFTSGAQNDRLVATSTAIAVTKLCEACVARYLRLNLAGGAG
jgi:hypothetical protein